MGTSNAPQLQGEARTLAPALFLRGLLLLLHTSIVLLLLLANLRMSLQPMHSLTILSTVPHSVALATSALFVKVLGWAPCTLSAPPVGLPHLCNKQHRLSDTLFANRSWQTSIDFTCSCKKCCSTFVCNLAFRSTLYLLVCLSQSRLQRGLTSFHPYAFDSHQCLIANFLFFPLNFLLFMVSPSVYRKVLLHLLHHLHTSAFSSLSLYNYIYLATLFPGLEKALAFSRPGKSKCFFQAWKKPVLFPGLEKASACVWKKEICLCVCVCVCQRERKKERDREKKKMCVCLCVCVWKRQKTERKRDRKKESLSLSL